MSDDDRKGHSEEREDFWGNKYSQHYDDEGNKTGWSEKRTDLWGDEYTQHHDNENEKTGWSEDREDLWGDSYSQHHDNDNEKTGWSEQREGFLGDKYQQHHDGDDNRAGWSERKEGFWGDKYTQHYGSQSSSSSSSAARHDSSSAASSDSDSTSRHSGSSSTVNAPESTASIVVRGFLLMGLLGLAFAFFTGVLRVDDLVARFRPRPKAAPVATRSASPRPRERPERPRRQLLDAPLHFRDSLRVADSNLAPWSGLSAQNCPAEFTEGGLSVTNAPGHPDACNIIWFDVPVPSRGRVEVTAERLRGDTAIGLQLYQTSSVLRTVGILTLPNEVVVARFNDQRWQDVAKEPRRASRRASNLLRIERTNRQLRLWMDHELIGETRDLPSSQAVHVGFYVGMDSAARFSDLRVYDASGMSAAAGASAVSGASGVSGVEAARRSALEARPPIEPDSLRPVATLLYQDDFGTTRQWRELRDSGPCESTYEDDAMLVRNLASSGACNLGLPKIGPFDTPVRIEVTVRLKPHDAPRPFGLGFGQDSPTTGYWVMLAPHFVAYTFGRMNTTPANDEWPRHPEIKKWPSRNTLTIELLHSAARLWINGTFANELPLERPAAGQLAFIVGGHDNVVEFSSVRIHAIETGTAQ